MPQNVRFWRISKERHADTAFTGKGAAIYGGRWNSKGIEMVYTCDSLALALLETTVHMTNTSKLYKYVYFCVTVPDDIEIEEIDPDCLEPNWSSISPPESLKKHGDDWIKAGRTAILCVPSAIVTVENNYLLNPAHPDFKRLIISSAKECLIDPRIKSIQE